MEPSNRFILPVIGLISPLLLYFTVGSLIAPHFTALGISNDILLASLGFVYLCVIIWGHHEGKSQSKFFKKYYKKLETFNENEARTDYVSKVPKKRYGTCFFINGFAILIGSGIWIFFNGSLIFVMAPALGVENIWYQIAVLIVLIFLCSNICRIFASIVFFNTRIGFTVNSIKFIILEEIIVSDVNEIDRAWSPGMIELFWNSELKMNLDRL